MQFSRSRLTNGPKMGMIWAVSYDSYDEQDEYRARLRQESCRLVEGSGRPREKITWEYAARTGFTNSKARRSAPVTVPLCACMA